MPSDSRVAPIPPAAVAEAPTTNPLADTSELELVAQLLSRNLPPLPPGLEMAIRKELLLVQLRSGGNGHVDFRVDMAHEQRAQWKVSSGGSGREERTKS